MPVTSSAPRSRLRTALLILAVLAALGIAVALWRVFMPEKWTSARQLGQMLRSLDTGFWGVPSVIGVYAVLASAFVPITALITGVALVFDPPHAFAYALCGSLLSATLSRALGRIASGAVLRRMQSPRLSRLREQLHNHTFSATVTARVLPVGNFTAINLLAGALAVPLVPFLLGNLTGMVFGIAGLTLLTDRLVTTFTHPTPQNIALAVLVLLVLIGVSIALSRFVTQRQRARSSARDHGSSTDGAGVT